LGFRVVARNVRFRRGEIDIVAFDGGTLAFVEVKYRSSERFGSPGETVDERKRARLRRAAASFLSRAFPDGPPPPVRFDVAMVTRGPDGFAVEIVRDAFE